MKKLIAMISAIAVIGTMSLTSFAAITVTPNAEVAGAALAEGATSGYTASYTSEDVNTQTTILAVKGATIDTNSIQYINQLTQDSETTINFDLKDTLAVGETVTVYMGGDKIARKTLGTIANVADAGGEDTEYAYDVALQNVTYNGTVATVARITGLDPAAVAVTVDETVANYYVRTTDSEDVIVACIEGTYTEADAVKALVNITEGTTAAIAYGNANGSGGVDVADVTLLARSASNSEVKTPVGTTVYSLPSDLTELHTLDLNADGNVDVGDVTLLARSASNSEVKTPVGTTLYSLDTMNCYKK